MRFAATAPASDACRLLTVLALAAETPAAVLLAARELAMAARKQETKQENRTNHEKRARRTE